MTVASNALLLTMLNKNMAVLYRVQRLQAFWRIYSETTNRSATQSWSSFPSSPGCLPTCPALLFHVVVFRVFQAWSHLVYDRFQLKLSSKFKVG